MCAKALRLGIKVDPDEPERKVRTKVKDVIDNLVLSFGSDELLSFSAHNWITLRAVRMQVVLQLNSKTLQVRKSVPRWRE